MKQERGFRFTTPHSLGAWIAVYGDNADRREVSARSKFSSIATPERPRKIPLGKHRYRFGSQLPSWAETPCASNEYCGEREEHAVPSVARTAVSPDLPVVNESVAV